MKKDYSKFIKQNNELANVNQYKLVVIPLSIPEHRIVRVASVIENKEMPEIARDIFLTGMKVYQDQKQST